MERQGKGFSLVELLVVVAMIAVLLALLLPALSRAREQTKMVQCLSNLKQLGTAMTAYLMDNNESFPRPAAGVQYEDWIYYDGGRNMNRGRLARYLGGTENRLDISIFRCPSDNIDTHPWYPYSYTVNEYLCRTQVLGNQHTTRLGQLTNPSDTIMIIDESSETIDDGCWAPQNYFGDGHNLLSNRHDREAEQSKDPNAGRGTVAFADGHAAFIPRVDSTKPQFFRAYPTEMDYNAP